MTDHLLSFVGRFVFSAIAFSCVANAASQGRVLIITTRAPISDDSKRQKD
jgi:hypothetical protein